MKLSLTPRYALTAPMIISSRLHPAVMVGDATVSVEATGLEVTGRAHFRFFVDVPNVGHYVSGDSDVTVASLADSSWSDLARAALELVCEGAMSDGEPAEWLPPALAEWARQNEVEFAPVVCDLQGDDTP